MQGFCFNCKNVAMLFASEKHCNWAQIQGSGCVVVNSVQVYGLHNFPSQKLQNFLSQKVRN